MSEEGICIIVGAGEFNNESLDIKLNDYVIAADGGYEYLKQMNIKPDIVLGDFDSVSSEFAKEKYIEFPSEKDETDMMIAVRHGMEKGYDIFHIYGGTGGRLSHTAANIQMLAWIASQGKSAYIYADKMLIGAVKDGTVAFEGGRKGFISVFSHSDVSKEVYIKGFKYPVNGDDLNNNISLGISNEFIGEEGSISVKEGTLIYIIEEI